MGKISFGLVFAALLLTASADVYDASTGYVTLIKDNVTGALTAFNSDVDASGNKFWRDEAAPHPETNYYVAAKQTIATPKPSDDKEWQGGRLVSAGKIWLVSGNDITFSDLVCLGSSASFYTAGTPGPLCGQITVQGTASNPVVFEHNTDSKMIMEATMLGEDDSVFCFKKRYRNATVVIRGNWNAFDGTLLLTRGTNEKETAVTNGFCIETAAIAGKLKATSSATVDTKIVITNAVTVGALELDDGVELAFGGDVSAANALGCLTVTGDVTLNGKPRIVVGSIDAAFDTSYSHSLLRFKDEDDQALTLDDFEIVSGPVVNAAFGTFKLRWEIGDSSLTGYRELRIVKDGPVGDLVRYNPSAASAAGCSPFVDQANSAGKFYWEDEGAPEPGKSYVIPDNSAYMKGPSKELPCQFLGEELYLQGSTLISANSTASAGGFEAKCMYWDGVTVQIWDGGKVDKTIVNSVVWFRFDGGRLYVPEGATIQNVSYNGQGVKFANEIVGGGTFNLSVTAAGRSTGRRSYNLFCAQNTNFTGRICVSAATAEPEVCKTDGLLAPTDDNCVSLFVTNGLSLGGQCPSFTYDALTLERYGRLRVETCDVELADGLNRGVYINGIGRMVVKGGLTLSVAWPVTVNGTFRKQGAGTLALGGTMRFADGDESTAPVEDKNLVRVEEGVLRLDAAHALDGAAVTLADGVRLVLKESATDDELAAKGLVNVKGDFAAARVASEATDGAIAVDIDASGCATAESATFGLFTVPTEAEAQALKAKVRAPRRVAVGDKNLSLSGALMVAQNADGTWTVSAKYEVLGLLLLVR